MIEHKIILFAAGMLGYEFTDNPWIGLGTAAGGTVLTYLLLRIVF